MLGAAWRRQAVARVAGDARHRGEGVAAQAREGAGEVRGPAARSCAGRCARRAPFPIEQAVLSISPGARGADGGSEFVVALAREDVIHQYEQACLMAGAHAGLVDLSTFGVINSILAGLVGAGGRLAAGARDRHLPDAGRDARQRAVVLPQPRRGSEGTLADLIHQTAMYYEDRLHGGGFARVLIAGGARLPGGAESVRRGLEERLRCRVESVDPRGAAAPAGSHRRVAGTARRAGAAGRHADARTEGGVAMLRTNLSTRPFYNERGVRTGARRAGGAGDRPDAVQRLRDPAAAGAEPRRAADDRAERRAGARAARQGAGHPAVDRQGEARRGAGGRRARPTR